MRFSQPLLSASEWTYARQRADRSSEGLRGRLKAHAHFGEIWSLHHTKKRSDILKLDWVKDVESLKQMKM